MDSNGSIAEHSLWSSCCNNDLLIWEKTYIIFLEEIVGPNAPEFSIGYANDVITPNSNFSLASYPGTFSNVLPVSCFWSTLEGKVGVTDKLEKNSAIPQG
jgi:hypothetical protein